MGPEFWLYFAVGFAAQLVDGALGMAYGVVTTTVLLAGGVTPANASASVHAAKVFTGAASAISHIAHRNVDWRLLVLLSTGGVVGGVLGTYILTSVDGDAIKPYVVGWLGLMGLVILYRAWKGARPKPFSWKSPLPLGLTGGFFDAVGGGGWGPVVTSTLLGSGADPRKVAISTFMEKVGQPEQINKALFMGTTEARLVYTSSSPRPNTTHIFQHSRENGALVTVALRDYGGNEPGVVGKVLQALSNTFVATY